MISQPAVCTLLLRSRLAGCRKFVHEQTPGWDGAGSLVGRGCKHILRMGCVIVELLSCASYAESDAQAMCRGAGIHVEGGNREAVSPVVHIRLAEQPKDACEAEATLQQVVSAALRKSGVLLSVNRMSKLDTVKGGPSIRWEAFLHRARMIRRLCRPAHCCWPASA